MFRFHFVSQTTRVRSIVTVLAMAAVAILMTNNMAISGNKQNDKGGVSSGTRRDFTVTHGVVATILTTPLSDGHQLGDQRVLPATPIYDLDGSPVGRLDAELLTTSINYPADGDEIRMSTLNFIFGVGDSNLAGSAHQIVVSGSGYYPGDESTIAVGDALVRSIVGGSGAFSGASGSCYTEHLQDGTWRHTFRFARP